MNSVGQGDMLTITAKATASPTTDLGEFRAIAADWLPDRDRERFERGAFSRAIEAWKTVGKLLPLIWVHKDGSRDVIGSVDPMRMVETDQGLEVGGNVDLGREVGQDAWGALKTRTLGLSLGFLPGKRFKGRDGITVLDEIDILEVSLTPKPVQPGTRVLDYKALEDESNKALGPAARGNLENLISYYRKKAHPFTECVRDNRKRFGPRAEAVCARLKDIMEGTTKWRNSGKSADDGEPDWCQMLYDDAGGDLEGLLEMWHSDMTGEEDKAVEFPSLTEQLDGQAAEDDRLRRESDKLLRERFEEVQKGLPPAESSGSDVGRRLKDTEVALVALEHFHPEELKAVYAGVLKAVWTAAYVNDLPDGSFLYVESGGSKDGEGKTTPRSLRHFPYKDLSGKVDLPHLRNALARIPQSSVPQAVKDRITATAKRILNDQKSTGRGQTRTRSVDPLFMESMHAVAGAQSGGAVSPPKPPPQQEPEEAEPPSVVALKAESRRLGTWLVTGDTENGDQERVGA